MPPLAKLTYKDGDGNEQELDLTPESVVLVGRHPACELTVARPSVSRKHARFIYEDGRYHIEDLGSSNGSYVNNQRITKSRLNAGDAVRCGDFEMEFTEVSPRRATARAPAKSIKPAKPVKPRVVGTIRPRRRDPEVASRPTVTADGPLEEAPTRPPRSPSRRTPVPPPIPAGEAIDVQKLRDEIAYWKLEAESRGEFEARAKEAEALRADLDKAEADREALGRDNRRLQQEIGDLGSDLDGRIRRIDELEGANRRGEEQRELLADRALKLKGQLQGLQDQLEEARQARDDLDIQLSEAHQEIDKLQASFAVGAQREVELAESANDLKRKVRQVDKAHKELEKELDLAEYNLKAARDENENLRLALGEDDSRREDLNTTIANLQQLANEKEEIIDQLQGELFRAKARIDQLQDQGGDASAAVELELEQARSKLQDAAELAELHRELQRELRLARKEIERLQDEQLEADNRATNVAAPSRETMGQLNELRRLNRDLKHEVGRLQNELLDRSPGGSIDASALEAELKHAVAGRKKVETAFRRAQRKIVELEGQLESIQTPSVPPPSNGVFEQLRTDAVELYESINDIASGLRMDIDLVGGYLLDLKPVIELITELPLDQFASPARERVRNALEEADALVTMESAEDLLNGARQSSGNFKRSLRKFREVLQRHGYGS